MSNDRNTDSSEGDEVEGHGRTPGRRQRNPDDTEGNMPLRRVTDAGESDEEDDTEGHLRLTDDQIAAGLTPKEVRDKERPQRSDKGDRRP